MASLVLYDGDCGICNRSVQFVWQSDPDGVFHFLPLQSEQAHQLLAEFGVTEVRYDTMYVVHEGQLTCRSAALVTILGMLPDYQMLGAILGVVPAPLRDLCYRVFAKIRHRIPKTECLLPPAEVRARFLEL